VSDNRSEPYWVDPPHPSRIDPERLWQQCEMQMVRRGGPGGQHRNKTSSGVVLTHRPTGLIGEAAERRSQADNRRLALRRLRHALAIGVRCRPMAERTERLPAAAALRQRYQGGSLRMAESNPDRPALLSLLLDDLWEEACELSAVADRWQTSSSQIVGLLRSFPPALELVNRWRRARNSQARRLR
jgi:hypothetical protein